MQLTKNRTTPQNDPHHIKQTLTVEIMPTSMTTSRPQDNFANPTRTMRSAMRGDFCTQATLSLEDTPDNQNHTAQHGFTSIRKQCRPEKQQKRRLLHGGLVHPNVGPTSLGSSVCHHGNSQSPSRNEPSALRLRIEKNTSLQTIRFCVRKTCTYISNKTFPSHLCAPQIKNNNSSLIVATAHRTHKPSLLTRKKEVHTQKSTAFHRN